MFLARTSLGPVDLAFTARYDGAGARDATARDPGAALDLALSADPAVLRRVVDDFAPGTGIAQMHQVHGRDAVVAASELSPAGAPACDALVTDRDDLTLVVRVADCVPVLLADPHAGVVGAVHAGRAGVAQGVVPAAVAAMAELGARALTAWIGPHVCGACYEVPPALQAEVAAAVPQTASTTRWGTAGLDLGAGVRAQLAQAGVRLLEEPCAEVCTIEDHRAWSHRRDGAAAGRMAGLVRLREPAR